jgi:predicted ArsR family transcriptional regulator
MNHTAPEIADALGVTPRAVRLWAEAGDLPRLERGMYCLAWATWLACGRKVATDWRQKPSAHVAVAVGWRQAQGRNPSDADMEALGALFKRNGYTAEAAMRALGAAESIGARA